VIGDYACVFVAVTFRYMPGVVRDLTPVRTAHYETIAQAIVTGEYASERLAATSDAKPARRAVKATTDALARIATAAKV